MATRPLPDNDYDDDVEEDALDTPAMRDKHDEIMLWFDRTAMPQVEMRANSLECRKFVNVRGGMWLGPFGDLMANAPRPEMDKITPALEKIQTDYRENRMDVDFIPSGSDADDDTAETLDGMHRADSQHFKSQQARDNAFQEGNSGGFGCWRLTTEMADPADIDNDHQRINPAMQIADADQCVYFDLAAKTYDKHDAKKALVLSGHPRQDVIDKYGDDAVASFPMVGWRYEWEWFRPDFVYLADYYEIEDKDEKIYILTQEESGTEKRFWAGDIEGTSILSDLKAQGWKRTTRNGRRPRCKKYVLSGARILKDCGYIAFSRIPLVPYYYRRDYIDNMEVWRGYPEKRLDQQRIFNTAWAQAVEAQSGSPAAIPLFYDDEITPKQADDLSRRTLDRLAYLTRTRVFDNNGNPISQQIEYLQPAQLTPANVSILQLLTSEFAEEDQNVEEVKANTSADAMDIAAARVDAKSEIPLDNFRQSIQCEGEIYVDGVSVIYVEDDRDVETLDRDHKQGKARLNESYINGSGAFGERNNFMRGKYKVVASVTESTATQQQKTVRVCVAAAEMAAKAGDQELAQGFMITAALNMRGEGMDDLHDWVRKKAVGMGLTKPTPEEAKALQEASQGKQPSPADQALAAQTAKLGSEAQLNQAKVAQTQADAALKTAQAEELSKAPAVPTGLSTPPENPIVQAADVASKLGSAKLNSAKADHLQHTMAMDHHEAGLQRIRTGADIAKQEHDQRMSEQAHELAKKQAERPAA